MSSVSKGKSAEGRATRIFVGMGFQLAARAKNIPVWKMGRVVANDGDVDLCGSSVDLIFRKRGRKVLYVQCCHVGGESPRRAKLRSIDWDPDHEEVLLLAWDRAMRVFHAYRQRDDWLKGDGWHLAEGDMALPWESATAQTILLREGGATSTASAPPVDYTVACICPQMGSPGWAINPECTARSHARSLA